MVNNNYRIYTIFLLLQPQKANLQGQDEEED